MKGVYVVVALLSCSLTLSTIDLEWQEFKVKYNKVYSLSEDVHRHKIFLQKKNIIDEHNKKFENGQVTYMMGINKFADMLPEETSYLRGYKQSPIKPLGAPEFEPEEGATYPDTVDWREKGYVTPVKDQGQCGSCWAFSATGSLEGQNFAKTGKLVSLSEQNLVDCNEANFGCLGGYMVVAYSYVQDNGIDTEEYYPYSGVQGPCLFNSSFIGGTCSSFRVASLGNEQKLLAAVATVGPISVGIDAIDSFENYQSGVYYEINCSPNYLNHAVLVVGYGTLNGEDYWLVKNSWGTEWGEEGYIKMSRNKNNNCGIASEATYPHV